MAQKFTDILSAINNPEIRQAIESLFGILGLGGRDSSTSMDLSLQGELTGDTTGSHFGAVTGDVTGDVTGNVQGDQTRVQTQIAADTDLDDSDFDTTLIELSGASASCNVSKFTPTVGKTYIISCSSVVTANPTLVASSGITLDGTNDTATFDAADECLIITCINATTCLIVENIGSVAMS